MKDTGLIETSTGHTKSVGKAAQYMYDYENMKRQRVSCCPLVVLGAPF
jgi:hypothetical protein